MKTPAHLRSLTANFSAYQGLKGIPVGLLLMLVSLWASAQSGPGPALYFPAAAALVLGWLYWITTRFYARVFGVVVPDRRQRIRNLTIEAALGICALAAFWIDTSLSLPLSALGVVFTAAILADYRRVAGSSTGALLWAYPAAALVMACLGLAPLLALNWWAPLGLKALLYAICAAAGLFFIILGLVTHISFATLLFEIEEAGGE